MATPGPGPTGTATQPPAAAATPATISKLAILVRDMFVFLPKGQTRSRAALFLGGDTLPPTYGRVLASAAALE